MLGHRSQIVAHTEGLFPANSLDILGQYDVIVDASDNPATRYLASDACCMLRKPLVSGAAIGTDGQLTVYCRPGGAELPVYVTRCVTSPACLPYLVPYIFIVASTRFAAGPCYRCLFPVSPAAENCSRCSETGVLGPVPGVIGVLQTLEAIKIISGISFWPENDLLRARASQKRLGHEICVSIGKQLMIVEASQKYISCFLIWQHLKFLSTKAEPLSLK